MVSGGDVADINLAVRVDLLSSTTSSPAVPSKGRRARGSGTSSAESDGEVVVMSVSANGPAAKAGLRCSDTISEVRDNTVAGWRISIGSSGTSAQRALKCRRAWCVTAARTACELRRRTGTVSCGSRRCREGDEAPFLYSDWDGFPECPTYP